jgi:hypothetical protein
MANKPPASLRWAKHTGTKPLYANVPGTSGPGQHAIAKPIKAEQLFSLSRQKVPNHRCDGEAAPTKAAPRLRGPHGNTVTSEAAKADYV